jgi:hypothetical protein
MINESMADATEAPAMLERVVRSKTLEQIAIDEDPAFDY